jgi:VanZ family protein
VLITRLACAAYWLCLTTLLLVPDVRSLLGSSISLVPTGVGVHFSAFVLLAFFVLASRLPLRQAPLAGLLIGYAVATELLQTLVPPRTAELKDFIEDVLGLAAGTAIWWVAQQYLLRKRKAEGDDE